MYLFKEISDTDRQMANGQRNTSLVPLTEEEIMFVKQEIIAIGAEQDMEKFIFNDKIHIESPYLGTGYDFINDVIYITKNVFPETQYGSIHPRDLMSVRAVLAHEYYGHRLYRNEYLDDAQVGEDYHTTPIWQDECRASITASKLCPNLTEKDKVYLLQDAIYRAKEFGQFIEMDDYMKGIIYGNYGNSNGERPITPIISPVRFVSESSIEGERTGSGNYQMSEMSDYPRCNFERE